jgi:hypothetical protein
MKWLRWIVASIAVFGVAAAVVMTADLGGSAHAQTVPSGQAESLWAQKSGLTLDTIHRIEGAALGTYADKHVATGKLTPDQANKLRNLVPGPILDRVLQGASQATGAAATDLANGLSQGNSLAQIAAAHGVQRDVLKSRLLSFVQNEAATEQSAGLATAQQTSMLVSQLTANLDKIIDSTHNEKAH